MSALVNCIRIPRISSVQICFIAVSPRDLGPSDPRQRAPCRSSHFSPFTQTARQSPITGRDITRLPVAARSLRPRQLSETSAAQHPSVRSGWGEDSGQASQARSLLCQPARAGPRRFSDTARLLQTGARPAEARSEDRHPHFFQLTLRQANPHGPGSDFVHIALRALSCRNSLTQDAHYPDAEPAVINRPAASVRPRLLSFTSNSQSPSVLKTTRLCAGSRHSSLLLLHSQIRPTSHDSCPTHAYRDTSCYTKHRPGHPTLRPFRPPTTTLTTPAPFQH